MAGALRELIELLLTEIAISGTDGACLSEVWGLIESFYASNNTSSASSSSAFHLDRALQEDLWEWLTLNPEVSVGKNKQYNSLSLAEAEAVPELRLFVSEERTWKALTGHERDESKVPATELTLLSIIASCRSQGILQTDLVRRSGQDARSVPKRTDALKAKGYIDKRQVQAKSAKTSLCTLSRFANVGYGDAERPAKSVQSADVIDFDAFCQDIFRILKKYQIIARNDLKDELGIEDTWRRRILSRAIRKLEAIGCVQRVKARSQFHDTMDTLHPCVLLVREPTEMDLKLFKSDYRTIMSATDQENEELEEQAEVQAPDRRLIQWTPDTNFANLIACLIKESGTAGKTNAEIIRDGFGKIFRRPSENTLNRITECWQLSQPPHLKSHAIVRDTALNGTVTHYVHYSYSNFKQLVDTGRADWEAVTFRPRDTKSSKLVMPPPGIPPKTDEDGLAPTKPPRKNVAQRDHYCTVSIKGLSSYTITKSDPEPMMNQVGHFVAVFPREVDIFSGHGSVLQPPPTQRVAGKRQNESTSEQVAPALFDTPRQSQMSKFERIEAELKKGQKSAREVFAAFGLDESWTHVAVRLMERNTPGVFITPKGKARPAGKRQGRPKESRIVVFRSPTLLEYLRSLPQPAANNVQAIISPNSTSQLNSQAICKDEPVITSRDDLNSQATHISPETTAKTASSILEVQVEKDDIPTNIPASTPAESSITDPDPARVQDVPLAGEQPTNSMTAVTRITETGNSENTQPDHDFSPNSSKTVPPEASNDEDEASTLRLGHDPAPHTPVIYSKSRRLDKEGSVARLRRAIIMDIIKQAGGAFPSGSEMWHAYSTIWMKNLKYTEKPDSRTVKNVVKHLIDSGKLRQITFSGKGPKGLMVTRSIVMTPETSPSSPLVTRMREEVLKSNYYVPDNVEVDSNITKIVRGLSGAPTGIYTKQLPVEPAMTVNLRTKPASVIALERRKEQAIHKRLSKPIRLMGLKHKDRLRSSEGITSFSRPMSKRLLKPRSRLNSEIGEQLLEGSIPSSTNVVPSLNLKHKSHDALSDRPPSEVKRRKQTHTESHYQQFLDDLDDVSQWELRSMLLDDVDRHSALYPDSTEDSAGFIHHTVNEAFEQAPIVGNIRFSAEKRTRKSSPSKPRLRKRRRRSSIAPEVAFKSSVPRQSLVADSASAVWRDPHAQQPMQKELYIQPTDSYALQPSSPVEEEALYDYQTEGKASFTLTRKRRRGLRNLSSSMVERIKHAIVVVRTIAGGTFGRTVDWDLVTKAFPQEDPKVIKMTGKVLLNRDRRQLAQMQDEFRVKLLAEYKKEDSSIPSINFNNMASYDWDAVVTWATAQYYSPSTRDVPMLPGSRSRLVQDLAHRVDHVSDEFETIYSSNPTLSLAKREAIFASRPFLSKLDTLVDKDSDQSGKKQAVKSWILSNIVAKETTYDASDASSKLSRLSNDTVEEAIKELIRDRFIAHVNRGRVVPGRNFVLTDNLHFTFGRRRAIDFEMLRQASGFKRVLDDDFKRDGVSQIKYDASDGEVLAVMALVAAGRVHIFPNDPPADPFGLTEGNYETRTLDKAIFKFQLDVVPDSCRYEYGNPLKSTTNERGPSIKDEEIARLMIGNEGNMPLAKLPLWLDINGNVHEDLWQSIVSAIVGILAIRPKIDVASLYGQLQKFLAPSDIERVLNWLEKCGVAENEGGAGDRGIWSVKEYWWMIWA